MTFHQVMCCQNAGVDRETHQEGAGEAAERGPGKEEATHPGQGTSVGEASQSRRDALSPQSTKISLHLQRNHGGQGLEAVSCLRCLYFRPLMGYPKVLFPWWSSRKSIQGACTSDSAQVQTLTGDGIPERGPASPASEAGTKEVQREGDCGWGRTCRPGSRTSPEGELFFSFTLFSSVSTSKGKREFSSCT